ncbi:hypothetical protein ACHAXA_006225 [Cyclostephanos tholiformis]|uniref:Apple domain-containing protein n=1 Tax=Cyclostephanos tholiformis TaxID=382380 RepID=A0ABD3SE83_9STRA
MIYRGVFLLFDVRSSRESKREKSGIIGLADDVEDGVVLPTGIALPQIEGDTPQRRRRPRRWGGIVPSSLRRWKASGSSRGQVVAFLASFATLVLVLLVLSSFAAISSNKVDSAGTSSSPSSLIIPPRALIEVPSCPTSPWKADEDLRGKCPESFRSIPDASSVPDCAVSCCNDSECITWQFRLDVGCLHGKDVRLGMEKDGVPAWCSDHAPRRWHGQRLVPRGGGKAMSGGGGGAGADDVRKRACDEATWNPEEEVGQCFGLGDVRTGGGGSARECMRACCDDAKCGAWQWNKELGCFYGKGMHSCQGHGDPIAFEPFVGRRKRLASRSYVGPDGKPWQMKMT